MKQPTKAALQKKLTAQLTYTYTKGDEDIADALLKARKLIEVFGKNKKEDVTFTYGQLLYFRDRGFDFDFVFDGGIECIQEKVIETYLEANSITYKD